ncbi:MAG: polysulfide reductase NrfD [Acidobacteriales bacterium]|nr:polysulfide reductase NrfD [Terriglobales bacterium]
MPTPKSPSETLRETSIAPDDPVLEPGHDFASVTEKVIAIPLRRGTPLWWIGVFAIAFGIMNIMLLVIGYLFIRGIGIWGVNIPVGWGFAIVNFVWWIGIGHAGTLISAILLLLKQSWRNSINRFAEAMTIFAVMCAALFPILHTGRPWLAAYWLFPVPLTMGVWPQFRSPLIWDVFAVSTYFTVSLLFWAMGMIPDLASLRDNARSTFVQRIYGMLAMGWRGSARHWKRYETAYLILAGLSTPLVLSVHTVVSFDFAASLMPGWHTTIFPPYFVAGAIYSGFAMVLVLAIPLRALYGVQDMITMRHLDNAAKVMFATGLIVAYGYFMEFYMAQYSGNPWELFMMLNRTNLEVGPYAIAYWALVATNIVIPQLLWLRSVRRTPWKLFLVSCVILVGMWLERFVIVITSLHRDFLPSNWGFYIPTRYDWAVFIGTLGLFTSFFFLVLRLMPMIPAFEVKTLLPEAKVHNLPPEKGVRK